MWKNRSKKPDRSLPWHKEINGITEYSNHSFGRIKIRLDGIKAKKPSLGGVPKKSGCLQTPTVNPDFSPGGGLKVKNHRIDVRDIIKYWGLELVFFLLKPIPDVQGKRDRIKIL
jgi:hypothetical protein